MKLSSCVKKTLYIVTIAMVVLTLVLRNREYRKLRNKADVPGGEGSD